MCRPQGNTNQDYEYHFKTLRIFLKILKNQKLPENKSVDKDVEKSETRVFLLRIVIQQLMGNSTAIYTKLNVEY